MKSTNNIQCLTCITVLCSMTIFTFASIYIAFTIIGLVNTPLNEIYDICNNSNLWIYSLMSLLFFIILIRNIHSLIKNDDNNGNNNKNIIIQFVILLIIIIWGIYEFFCVNCIDKLSRTILYKISFINWIFNIVMLVISCINFGPFNFTNNIKIQNSIEDDEVIYQLFN